MSESFVDLSYRGLSLARRVKLTQVRPTTGYVEMPAPMPVGTTIGIATDEGVMLEATVTEIREQVGGSDKAPGMHVRPKLDVDTAKEWWKQRVELPIDKAQTVPPVGTVMPKRMTGEGAVPDLVDDGRTTDVHEIVDPDEGGPKTIAMEAVPEDAPKTVAMDAVDLKALGLEPSSSSGQMPAAVPDDDDPGSSQPGVNGNGKKKKRRRR